MNVGFFKLFDHDVRDEIRINFQNSLKSFFALSKEEKNKVRQNPKQSTKGYFGPGRVTVIHLVQMDGFSIRMDM